MCGNDKAILAIPQTLHYTRLQERQALLPLPCSLTGLEKGFNLRRYGVWGLDFGGFGGLVWGFGVWGLDFGGFGGFVWGFGVWISGGLEGLFGGLGFGVVFGGRFRASRRAV